MYTRLWVACHIYCWTCLGHTCHILLPIGSSTKCTSTLCILHFQLLYTSTWLTSIMKVCNVGKRSSYPKCYFPWILVSSVSTIHYLYCIFNYYIPQHGKQASWKFVMSVSDHHTLNVTSHEFLYQVFQSLDWPCILPFQLSFYVFVRCTIRLFMLHFQVLLYIS